MASYLAKCAVVTLAVSGGFHYDTCYKKPSDPTKAHILFIHGFPSSAYDWRHQVEFFADQGYGIIVPDLLGYGGTSKPEDPADYTAEAIGDSLIEVVKQVTKNNHTKVLGVGHDWGSIVLSRLANFHPHRFLSYSFVAVSYIPSGFFNLTALNEASTAAVGHAVLGYNKLLQRQASFVDLIYPKDLNKTWSEDLGPIGACRAWLTNNTMGPRATYITAEEFAIHHKIFKKENGGYTPALNSYRALIRGLNVPAENNLTAAQQTTNLSTLYIGVTDDPEVDLGVENFFITSFSSQPTLKNISAGHWPQLQHPDTVNNLLKDFFDRKGS